MLLTLGTLETALELGCIYGLVALSLFLSFSILNLCDLSTDGCFTLGCAICCQVTLLGHPIAALFCAMAAGVVSGYITALLQTKFSIASILAGIIVNTGLYTINLMAMGFSSNMSVFKSETIFSMAKTAFDGNIGGWYKFLICLLIVAIVGVAMFFFLRTRLGLSIRATGDSPDMVRASSINPSFTVTVGLCISGSLTALAGAVLAQYQKSCDINLGTGMVTIALASLIIGESLFGRGGIPWRIFGAVVGACLYRIFVAIALRVNIPAECMKLVSAIIVAVAIALPSAKTQIAFRRQRAQRQGGRSC